MMTLTVIPNFPQIPGLGAAIQAAGHVLQAVMQPDQTTVVWSTAAESLAAVQALIAAHDPLPFLRQPYLKTLADLYAAKIAAGYRHGDGHVYQLGPDSLGSSGIVNLNAIASLCQRALAGIDQAWPNGSYIRDMANNNVVYSAAQALDVCVGAGTYVSAVRRRYWQLKAALGASPTPGTIDLATGWPG